MGEKFTLKDFNEEMFFVIYQSVLSESVTVSHLVESALTALEGHGYDVPEYEETWEGGSDVEDNPQLRKRFHSFINRFQKLTGYNFE